MKETDSSLMLNKLREETVQTTFAAFVGAGVVAVLRLVEVADEAKGRTGW